MPWQASQSKRNVDGGKKFINFSSKTIIKTTNWIGLLSTTFQEPEPKLSLDKFDFIFDQDQYQYPFS